MSQLFSFIFGRQRAEIGRVIIDASVRESHEANSDITTNPVESGVDNTDHVRNLPLSFSIDGVISDTPISIIGLNINAGLSLLGFSSRSKDAYDTMMDIRDRREPFDVVTGLRIYKNMVFESLVINRNATIGQSLQFTARLKEIEVVKTRKSSSPLGPLVVDLSGIKIDVGKVVSSVLPDKNPLALGSAVVTEISQLVSGATSIFDIFRELRSL